MPDKTRNDDDKPRDEEEGVFVPQTSTREILDIMEKLGEKEITTTEIKEELGYTAAGTIRRLEKQSEYVERKDLGEGNPTIWKLKYTRRDFLDALDELDNTAPTQDIAERIGCSEEVARDMLFNLEEEGE
jgi:DNA-binding Lrp family transcriptional regulator